MKKILFIVSDLKSGGVQKSFVNLINTFDRQRYTVDIYLLCKQGLYLDLLPVDLRIHTSELNAMLVDYFPNSIKRLIKAHFYLLAFKRIVQFVVSRFDRGYGGYLMSRLFTELKENYDVAIDYGGQQLLYFMVDRISANKKVSFFHNDYSQWDWYYNMDKKYYPKIDIIATISNKCLQSLMNYFPSQKSKMLVIENISSPDLINKMASESVEENIPKYGFPFFVTLGRLSPQKGIHLAIESARQLKDKGLDFLWFFIGEGEQRIELEKKILKYGLEDQVKLVGLKINPYKYIKRCDIYIHTARFEGKSIALDEAKILCKPIVVTNFSTVYDQFTNRVNATICKMDAESLCDSIIELLQNKELQQQYIENLKSQLINNTNQVEILYKLIEG